MFDVLTPRRLRRALVPVIVAVAVLAAAPSAFAVTWYSKSAPLKVYEHGRPQGYAHGNFKNYNGVSARSYSYQKDAKPGGSGIYVETAFYFYAPCGDGSSVEWCYYGTKSTTNTTSGSWVADYTAKYLDGDGARARSRMKICENHHLASDPCSVQVIRSFTY